MKYFQSLKYHGEYLPKSCAQQQCRWTVVLHCSGVGCLRVGVLIGLEKKQPVRRWPDCLTPFTHLNILNVMIYIDANVHNHHDHHIFYCREQLENMQIFSAKMYFLNPTCRGHVSYRSTLTWIMALRQSMPPNFCFHAQNMFFLVKLIS